MNNKEFIRHIIRTFVLSTFGICEVEMFLCLCYIFLNVSVICMVIPYKRIAGFTLLDLRRNEKFKGGS
jgi:hypothetical protein